MGRVNKYKKFKACDPFSKRGKTEIDTIHDEPPDIHEEKVRKANQKRERYWDDEERRELILSREALKFTVDPSNAVKKKVEKKLEKRNDESMKEFKHRVRNETRTTLKEELQALSASRQKKKLKLKERSLKKKMKSTLSNKAGNNDDLEDEENDFRTAEDGRIRPSDLNGPSTFKIAEPVMFGETLNAMPDLNKWKAALTKKMTKKATLDHDDLTTDTLQESNTKVKDKNVYNNTDATSKKVKITDLMNTDDSIFGRMYATDYFLENEDNNNNHQKRANLMKFKNISNNNNNKRKLSESNLDQLREESRSAYQRLKQSRVR